MLAIDRNDNPYHSFNTHFFFKYLNILFVIKIKQIMTKVTPYRIQLHYEMIPIVNHYILFQSTIIWWDAWLESTIYYADIFEHFKNVIRSLQVDCKQILTKLII